MQTKIMTLEQSFNQPIGGCTYHYCIRLCYSLQPGCNIRCLAHYSHGFTFLSSSHLSSYHQAASVNPKAHGQSDTYVSLEGLLSLSISSTISSPALTARWASSS